MGRAFLFFFAFLGAVILPQLAMHLLNAHYPRRHRSRHGGRLALAAGVLLLSAVAQMAARMMRVAAVLLVLSGFATVEAIAMMSPEEYRAAREAATYWMQLRIDAVKAPPDLPGSCIVRGKVTRVFRGSSPAAKSIDLEVECKRRGERSPPGDEFRVDIEELRAGRYVEAFANLSGGRFIVAARQIEFVANPGPTPTFTGKE